MAQAGEIKVPIRVEINDRALDALSEIAGIADEDGDPGHRLGRISALAWIELVAHRRAAGPARFSPPAV